MIQVLSEFVIKVCLGVSDDFSHVLEKNSLFVTSRLHDDI